MPSMVRSAWSKRRYCRERVRRRVSSGVGTPGGPRPHRQRDGNRPDGRPRRSKGRRRLGGRRAWQQRLRPPALRRSVGRRSRATAPPSSPPPPPLDRAPGRRRVWGIALAALTALLTVVAIVVAVAVVGRHTATALSVRRILAGPGSIRVFPAGPLRHAVTVVAPGPVVGVDVLAVVLLIVGIVGLGLVLLYWSPWWRRGPRTPSGR